MERANNHIPAEEINIPIANNMKLEVLPESGVDKAAYKRFTEDM